MSRPGLYWSDRAVLVEQGARLLGSEWYVRFGRRQLLNVWLGDHSREQAQEMFAHTAMHEGIPLRILELFPIVEPKKIRAVRAYFPKDLCEDDVQVLRGFLDHQATLVGLQIEPESVELNVRVDEGSRIFLAFSALAR